MTTRIPAATLALGAWLCLSACEGPGKPAAAPGVGSEEDRSVRASPPATRDPEAMNDPEAMRDPAAMDPGSVAREDATLGAGCFWCVEAVLEQIDGVLEVTSGYMGGTVPNPSYEEVSTGVTGHAEVVRVAFDPARISYAQLLDLFWKLHDPTTLNRQGNDIGTQYRSAIFYHGEEQRLAAERSKEAKDASGALARPIVTEIVEAGTFYEAEEEHQDYYRLNKAEPYCRYVIAPKLEELGLER